MTRLKACALLLLMLVPPAGAAGHAVVPGAAPGLHAALDRLETAARAEAGTRPAPGAAQAHAGVASDLAVPARAVPEPAEAALSTSTDLPSGRAVPLPGPAAWLPAFAHPPPNIS